MALMTAASWAGTSEAQRRLVDDEAILAPSQVRVSTGFGLVESKLSSSISLHPILGTGLDLAESVGLGHGLELGVRFGARLDAGGRALRADEVARAFDTETFGTGLSTVANPELRLRWQVIRWAWGAVGVDERVVLPIRVDPDVTDVFGPWLVARLGHVARVDAAVNVVFARDAFAGADAFAVAVGLPIRIWVNVLRPLSLGLVTALHEFGPTPYTHAYSVLMAGVGADYRARSCDFVGGAYLPDAASESATRLGFGINIACTLDGDRPVPGSP